MSDQRVTKLADVLVNYSLEIKAGQKFLISASPLASELSLAVYQPSRKGHMYWWSNPSLRHRKFS